MCGEKNSDKIRLPMSSCKPLEIPTDDEIAALNKMREIKERVKDLKEKQSQLRSQNGENAETELKDIETKIVNLRSEWKEWEKKKDEAARERMILLGHEDP